MRFDPFKTLAEPGRVSPFAARLSGILALGLVFLADVFTGDRAQIDMLYLLPLIVTSLHLASLAESVALGVAILSLRFLALYTDGAAYSSPLYFSIDVANVCGSVFLTLILCRKLRGHYLKSQALSRTDPLTGLLNRRAFDTELDAELLRRARSGAPFSLAMIDLDGFKAVNDERGHAAGDEVLRRVAAVLTGQMRKSDVVARVGGDEFAILMPSAGSRDACAICRQLAGAVAGDMHELSVPVTASIGCTTAGAGGASAATLLQSADEAMYLAKRNGKGCVVAG